ncbi:MAG: PilZ domain-containing protein [Thermodesulfobacteriota bacterium]
MAVEAKARTAENSFLEITYYYQRAVKVASFLICIMTFFLIVFFSRLISSLFVVLEYAFQSFKKVKVLETKGRETKPISETGRERRKYARFNVYWPIQYNQIGSPISHDGRVTNLSEGGMLFLSPGQMEIGQHLKSKLSFISGSQINTIQMQAVVVWRDIYPNEAWGDYRCGAKFLDISTGDRTELNNLLMSHPQ